MKKDNISINRKRFKLVIFLVLTFTLILCLVHITNSLIGMSLNNYGIQPRTISGLIGILTCPLLHGDWNHLISNSVTFIPLAALLFFFYPKIGYKLFVWSWLIIGALVWLFAKDSIHIGASGIIYSIAAFLVVSGIIRRYYKLMAISLIVLFTYGSMIWGILPLENGISWESHLFGLITGLFLAFIYRKQGPQKPITIEQDSAETTKNKAKDHVIMEINSNYIIDHTLFSNINLSYPKDHKNTNNEKD